MNHTRWALALIRLLPFRSGLSSGLRRHLEQCPECLGRMADIQEARVATIGKDDLVKVDDFWPRLALGLERPKLGKKGPAGPGWGWAVGAAGLLACVVVGLYLRVPPSRQEALTSGVKMRVNSVSMYDKPAQAFIFQTRDANSTFIWVEKQKTGEVL